MQVLDSPAAGIWAGCCCIQLSNVLTTQFRLLQTCKDIYRGCNCKFGAACNQAVKTNNNDNNIVQTCHGTTFNSRAVKNEVDQKHRRRLACSIP